MRNYSEPPYTIEELSAAFTGLCKSINEPVGNGTLNLELLPNAINPLSLKYGSSAIATGEAYSVGVAIQSLIDTLVISQVVDIDNLKNNIDCELSKLPPSYFIDYFTGERKY